MSGRGRRAGQGGRGGHSNRSGRFSRGGNSNTASIQKKKSIEDYYYYVGSLKQAADYSLTTEQVINHIKKEYDHGVDVAKALRTQEEPDQITWQPRLNFQDAAIKAPEDEQ